jgi:hypothetical protein
MSNQTDVFRTHTARNREVAKPTGVAKKCETRRIHGVPTARCAEARLGLIKHHATKRITVLV